MSIFFDQYYNTGIGFTPFGYGGEQLGFFDAMGAAYDAQVRGSNIDTYTDLMREELQPLIDAIGEREGLTFSNPGRYFGASDSMGHSDRAREQSLDKLFTHLDENRDLYPEFSELTRTTLDARIRAEALAAIESGQEAKSRETTMGMVGGFIGQGAGVFMDQAFLDQMVMMGPMAFIRRGRPPSLGRTMLAEGLIGAGTEAMLQPGVREWYQSLGLDYSYEQMLINIGLGGIIGAGLPPVMMGAGKGVSMTTDQVRRGLELFRGNPIPAREADLAIDALDDFDALTTNVPREITSPDTFMPDPPETVVPIRSPQQAIEADNLIAAAKRTQPYETFDELYEIAPAFQARLETVGRTIDEAMQGVTFKTPGLKKRAVSEEKLVRKSLDSPKELNDVVRAGFLVETAARADEVVAVLGANFDIIDEGWKVTPAGYFDRKVIVRNEDGLVGEIQLWSQKLLEAKDQGGGHDLYKKWRSAKSPRQKAKLMERQRRLFLNALAQEHQSFQTLLGMLNGPKRSAKRATNASSEGMTSAELKTSKASTETQSPPGSSRATADSPEADSMAGRPSQDVNRILSNMDSTSTPNIVDSDPTFNDVANFLEHLNRADEATANLERGLMPDDVVDPPDTRPLPQETAFQEAEVSNTIEQVARDTDFDNMPDDEVLTVDMMAGDEVVPVEMTGRQIKAELAQDERMLDRLRGCVV